MLKVYVVTALDHPETYKECTRMNCPDCEFWGGRAKLTCNRRRKLYHEAYDAGTIHRHQDVIGKISLKCLAFDYSPENDGEATLREIRELIDKELVTHR